MKPDIILSLSIEHTIRSQTWIALFDDELRFENIYSVFLILDLLGISLLGHQTKSRN